MTGHGSADRTSGQVRLTFLSSDWGAEGCTWRAVVGVSFRWVSLLPPSLLQPRVSPMGCNGISYSKKPKKRSGVLLPTRWELELVQRCSQAQKKNETKTKLQGSKTWKCHLQVDKTDLSRLVFCLQLKNKKSIHVLFIKDDEWDGMKQRIKEEGKNLSVPFSSCPDAGLWSTFPISCTPGWKEGRSRVTGQRRRERKAQSISLGTRRCSVSEGLWVRAGWAPTPRTYNQGLCTSLLQFPWLTPRSLSHWLILGKTDWIVPRVNPLHTKSKCL